MLVLRDEDYRIYPAAKCTWVQRDGYVALAKYDKKEIMYASLGQILVDGSFRVLVKGMVRNGY